MYFGYCYDWMYGKCTGQQRKYLHQKPPPGTKPITPRTTAGPVVEGEEEEAPRSPALIRAAAVHAQVLLDNDDDIDTNPGDVRGHRVVRKPKYTRKVAAPVGYSGVRWLVDTGYLKGPDRALIARIAYCKRGDSYCWSC